MMPTAQHDDENGIARLEVALIQLNRGMDASSAAGHALVLEEKHRVMNSIGAGKSWRRLPVGKAPGVAAPPGAPPMPTASTTAPDEIERAWRDLGRERAELSRGKMAFAQRMAMPTASRPVEHGYTSPPVATI